MATFPSLQRLRFRLALEVVILVATISAFFLCRYDRCVVAENIDVTVEKSHAYLSPEVFWMNYAEMKRNLKIYIYPEGYEDSNFVKTIGYYATEEFFFQNLRESSFLTDDPNMASYFFIPISYHKLHEKVSSNEEMASVVGKYVEGLIRKYSYWNKTLGVDHFLLTCYDVDVEATQAVPMLVKNSIRVVCSSTYNAGFIPRKDVSIPSVMQPFSKPTRGNGIDNRTILGYWAGVRNSDSRHKLVNLWGADEELDIKTKFNLDSRMEKLQSAKFCICPVGSRNTNSRITMAILHGCVPVILENYFDLPFNDVLDWQKFSVILNEDDIHRLKDILKAKAVADYKMLYSNLIKVQIHFQWNAQPVEYDAFHMVMHELWLRRSTIRYSKQI